MSELIQIMPAVAMRGITVLPRMIVHFDISRSKSIKAIEKAMLGEQKILLITQKDSEATEPTIEELYKIGTVCQIKKVIKLPNKIVRVLVEGIERAELLSFLETENFLEVELTYFDEKNDFNYTENEEEAMTRSLRELFLLYSSQHSKMNQDILKQIMSITELKRMIEQISVTITLEQKDKQHFLEAIDIVEQYEALIYLLSNELEILKIKKEIQEKVKERVEKNQKEYVLREQLKIIREELGEDNTQSDAEQFQEELQKLKANKEVKAKIQKEINRFKGMSANSSENSVLKSYIETLFEIPWEKSSKENKDLKKVAKVLEQDHYGLEKVKERIMEFLAVRLLTKRGESPILCLVGPPGTGKTSIARSIATALKKEYIRISLGGVRDEAEIRGHRRTYVGAMPGRIVNGLRQAKVKNPLLLLDEIDKTSSDYKGDTASALLEVLDSEQNKIFRDHYVELPIDLSEVLFIATANSYQGIPKPLLDRMEIIEISSYTENEKEHIATDYLMKKQIEKNGLSKKQLNITKEALQKIIRNYTKEAGVRELERKIGQVCRKTAREILEEEKSAVKVNDLNIQEYLGKPKYQFDMANAANEVGLVRGLAWTSVGGDTLEIEVNLMPGKGEFMLTGQMGDIMKESAQTGISYIRSISKEYDIAEDFFQKNDIHIHIPEGAVPKDGPSAGITMATAMLSAITNTAVLANVAMTGEITLRGRVLPIGGLKEKLLAAKNAGIKKVIVPNKNKMDVEEISDEITSGMEIIFASAMSEVIENAFLRK
jgi:ATP-dependent protease La